MAFACDLILEAEMQEDCELMASVDNITRHVSYKNNV